MCNSDGLRVKKVATSTGTTDYTLHGKNVVHLTNGTNSLHFYYDAQNRPAVVEYNWVPYAYVHNLQGDIIAIVDANGTKVVEYKYDAWGKPLSKTGSLASTLGTLNPFRYRGYVYDEENELYYCESRFFSVTTARWLNADDRITIEKSKFYSANLFAYCINSPQNYMDKEGHSIAGLIGIIAACASGVAAFGLGFNHGYNAATTDVFGEELQDTYTVDEAKTAIDKILSQYADDCYVTYTDTGVEIHRSYLVDNRKTRQKVCMIIARSGVTDREADNLAAEWNGHNIAYSIGIMKGSAEHALLDYDEDKRWYVRWGTGFLEMVGAD